MTNRTSPSTQRCTTRSPDKTIDTVIDTDDVMAQTLHIVMVIDRWKKRHAAAARFVVQRHRSHGKDSVMPDQRTGAAAPQESAGVPELLANRRDILKTATGLVAV